MKRLVFILLNALLTTSVFAQVLQPAKWDYSITDENPKVNDVIEIVFNVAIEEGWYLYSTDFDEELGPKVTTFIFEANNSFELVGDVVPVGAKKKYDELWEGDITYFRKKAEIRQKIKVKEFPVKINGTYEYQVCTDEKCIPFDDEFSISLKGNVEESSLIAEKENVSESSVKKGEIETIVEKQVDIPEEADASAKIADEGKVVADEINTVEGQTKDKSLMGFFFISILAGLAAILTPCVFPMIPMTVTFFMKDKESKRKGRFQAMVFGISIIAIYTFVGSILAVIAGPGIANFLSTHWLPNILFFLIFMFFAASFLGMFEIVLPSWLINKSDAQVDKGGMFGSVFMAVTLVLVSFSCTGPIVGAILVESAGGEILKPIIGMLGFSLAFAMPFTLFAFFPGWLKGLPKSGGWLNSVKVVLGFLEIALGLKFLSVADQTYHWGILDREVYLALWIIIFTFLGFYLLGKIRLSHDSKMEKVGVPRLLMALVTFSFVIYLLPGMIGAPLKGLAGYLPPQTTHDFDLISLIKENKGSIVSTGAQEKKNAKYSDFLHLPHGLEGYFDYEEALAAAKKENKPVFIDFTGHGCVNCREMEARVWSDPEVLKRLKDDYVVVALYVDDKTKLPEGEWYTSDYDGKVKKTIGKQNADFQIKNYNVNAQPYYVLLDINGEMLTEPKAYDLDPANFTKFLDSGIQEYKKRNMVNSGS